MDLVRLSLTNFQGVKDFTLDACGESVTVYGSNNTGKSTVCRALCWLLLGSSAVGTGFDPHPYAPGNNAERIHHLDTTVTGIFDVDGGMVELSKVFKEKWNTKRGSDVEQLIGNTTEYYIDGVPVKEKDYDAQLNDIADLWKRKILMQPGYFASELSWKDRSAILLDMCGDVTDADVITSDPELADLTEYLANGSKTYKIDEFTAIAESSKKKLNAEIMKIPIQVNEAYEPICDVGESEQDVESRLQELSKGKDFLIEKRANLSASTVAGEYRQQRLDVERQMQRVKAEYTQKAYEAGTKLGKAINEVDSKIAKNKNALSAAERDIADLSQQLFCTKSRREQLAAAYSEAKEKAFTVGNCPVCGQPYPDEKRDELKKAFNKTKSDKLERIRDEMQNTCSKEIIAGIKSNIAVLTVKADTFKTEITALETEKQNLIDAAPAFPDFEETDEYKAFQDVLTKLDEQIDSCSDDAEHAKIDKQINNISAEIESCNKVLAKIRTNEAQRNRIDELTAKLDRAKENHAYYSKGLHLCDIFAVTRANLLNDIVNSKFENVRWKLFKQQMNGGIERCCEAMVKRPNGLYTAYDSGADTNTAAKINAGIEIIDVLSKHWGIQMPVVLDNAESVVDIDGKDQQIICFKVSEGDNILRVEAHG